jgi:hypothetical protein
LLLPYVPQSLISLSRFASFKQGK